MATNQSSIYIQVTQELLEQLQTYQTQHDISTTADAVTKILIHFFESDAVQSKTAASSTQANRPQVAIFQPDDDIEDEPDEILWDFLPDEEQ